MIRCFGCMAEYENGLKMCPHCGYEAEKIPESPLHMVAGSMLFDRYLVGKVIGYGGFGVTYIGWDSILQQRVAIKEYLPSEFATRSMGQADVTVFGGNKAQQFADGMAKFIDEAKRLAQFQSEDGIVRVYDSFEANNTAYIIMEYLEGETLTAFLSREGKVPVEKAIELMTPVIQSLEAVHKAGIIHRDISPDNIMITKDGKVKLIDFGAARYATTSHSRSLTVIIKPGYSPEEQYRRRGGQGPYTDVYALGAVLYRMVTGETPPDALERHAFFENKKKDILVPPSKNCKIPKNIENAVLNAMNMRIEDRTPSADTFLKQLTSEAPVQRVMGKIKGIDLMKWPLWAKIIIPTGGIVVAALLVLLATGKIGFANNLITTLTLGENMTRVPSVINYSVDAAQNELGKQALVSIISGREPSDVIPANMVMRQSISAGEIVEKNSTVELFISTATIPVIEKGKMPDVAYYTEAEATDMLYQLGAIISVEQEYSNSIAAGIVIRSSVGMGEPLSVGSKVTLYVSMGPTPTSSSNLSTPGIQTSAASIPKEILGQENGPSQNNEPVTSEIFTNDMVKPEELTVGGSAFWNVNIEKVAMLYPTEDERASWFQSNGNTQYTAMRDNHSIVNSKQNDSETGLSEFDINITDYTELRNIIIGMHRQDVLKNLGISDAGVEYCMKYDFGKVLRFVCRNNIWREDIETAGTTSPGTGVEFVWINYKSNQELILSLLFDESDTLKLIHYTFMELGYDDE